MTTTATATSLCGYCGATYTGRSYTHDCATRELPRATRRDGAYALRNHRDLGYVLWIDVAAEGTSTVAGAVADPANFAYACQVIEAELAAEAI